MPGVKSLSFLGHLIKRGKQGAFVNHSNNSTSAVALPPVGSGSDNHLMIQKIKGLPGTPRGLNSVKILVPPPKEQEHNPVTGREDFGHRENGREWMEFKRLGSI